MWGKLVQRGGGGWAAELDLVVCLGGGQLPILHPLSPWGQRSASAAHTHLPGQAKQETAQRRRGRLMSGQIGRQLAWLRSLWQSVHLLAPYAHLLNLLLGSSPGPH